MVYTCKIKVMHTWLVVVFKHDKLTNEITILDIENFYSLENVNDGLIFRLSEEGLRELVSNIVSDNPHLWREYEGELE